MKYLAMIFLMAVSCGNDSYSDRSEPLELTSKKQKKTYRQKYELKCKVVHGNGNIERCVNSEVICYKYYSETLQCHFKSKKVK